MGSQETQRAPTIASPLLEARQLGKTVTTANGETRLILLENIDLTVAAGETLAIVGASGSGKSTLLGLLAGLDLPTQGSVRIRGQDLAELDEDGRAALRGRELGFVFQSFQLMPSMSALENVMLPLELAGDHRAAEKARHMLAQVGLSARLQHYPRHLSGGEQQRVALARAFVSNPGLLFADEPTGNLDSQTGAQIIDLLFAMNQTQGTTLILVTHDAQLARRCARQLTLEAGHLLPPASEQAGII